MSVPVAIVELAEQTKAFGSTAYLVTVGSEDRPHVVATTLSWIDGNLVVGAGRTTRANIERRPDVTLVWPAPPGAGYSLIVDGRAGLGLGAPGAGIVIEARKAVLHRTPDGDPAGPSCITVLPRP